MHETTLTVVHNFLPISVCIPTRNEESNLPTCLTSLQGAFDDVVVVDSDSVDNTPQICKDFGATLLNFKWNGRLPKKRNWALAHHAFKHPWILFIDADERLTPAVIDELQRVIPTSNCSGYWLAYTNWFMNRQLKHGDPFRKLALFRRDAGRYEEFPENWWSHLDMEVHEHPVLSGPVGNIQSPIEHHDYRGLKHYFSKHNEYSSWEANRFHWLKTADANAWNALTPRQRFKYRYLDKWWLSAFYFSVCYFAKLGILDGYAGWVFARLKSRYFDDIRLKIRELQGQS